MTMHNPPHPGLVLREYLGETPVSVAAAHLRVTRVTLSRRTKRQVGNLRRHGHSSGGRAGHYARAVDEYAVAVRPVAGTAIPATGGTPICACGRRLRLCG